MKPHSHEEHIQHTFDAFCKKVLRNEARDYLDELARKRNREISFSDLPVEVMEQLSTCDIYFVEKQSFGVLDYRVHIDNDELAEAIAALPAQKRDIWCQKESLFFHVNPNLCRLVMGSDWFINEEKIL